MSMLLPDLKPLALQMLVAAVSQSGAPFGATRQTSCPATTVVVGSFLTRVSAASFAVSAVVLAATPASRPKLSNALFAPDSCSSNHLPTEVKNPGFSFLSGAPATCASAAAADKASTPAQRRVCARYPIRDPKPMAVRLTSVSHPEAIYGIRAGIPE